MDEIVDEIRDLDEALVPEEEAEEEFVLATISEVTANGVKLEIDGAGEAGDKEYKVNTIQKLKTGDRVKICKNSGTYMVEYKIGSPMADYPIPSGGTDGQYLVKDGSTDYSVKWVDGPSEVHGIPSGGSQGQVLAKTNATNYNVSWQSINTVPGTGTTGHVLTKTASGYGWAAAPTELPTGGSAGQVLTKTSSGVSWSNASSPSSLVSGSYSVTVGNVLTPTTGTYAISLGDNSHQYKNLYLNGDAHICGSTGYLGFFGVTAVRRQTTITASSTLAQVIQALKNYGLF